MRQTQLQDIRAHPSMDKDLQAVGHDGSGPEASILQEEESDVPMEEIHQRVKDYVKQLLPKSELVTEFNGNYMYFIPNAGFNASHFYTEFEANKARLKISDWGLSQSTLEDVFTVVNSKDGGNLA